MSNRKEISDFVSKLKDQTRVYSNFLGIMEKAERDGYLQCIHLTLSNIFQQEIKFAVFGNLIRTNENKSEEQTGYNQKATRDQFIRF